MKTKQLLIAVTLGLALTLGLLGLLGGQPTLVTAAPAATTRYVDDATGTDDSDCSDPDNPCKTVQYAVDQASAGDIIKVAGGTYRDTITRTPPAGYLGEPASGVITQVVYISKPLTIRGGYTATDWTRSDPAANPTTLDGEGGKRVVCIGGDITVALENLKIFDGDATGLGGGIIGTVDAGGGVYVISATVTLSGNDIYSNTAEVVGGVWLSESDGATLSGNDIYSNTADVGGGVALDNSDGATLSGNDISCNTARDVGGGVLLAGSDGTTLDNNVIADNQAIYEGSGVYVISATADLRHNTIARNTGGDDSGGVCVTSDIMGEPMGPSTVTMTNNILVGHTVGITVGAGCTATLDYTLWATGTAWRNGTNWVNNGALNHDHGLPGPPHFVDPDNGDYHIGPDSAAIDQGPDAGVSWDKDGISRPQGVAFDLGAYEVPAPIGGYTAPVNLLALLWPQALLAALVATRAIAAAAFKRRAA